MSSSAVKIVKIAAFVVIKLKLFSSHRIAFIFIYFTAAWELLALVFMIASCVWVCRPRLDVACSIVRSVDKIYKSQVPAETNNTTIAE